VWYLFPVSSNTRKEKRGSDRRIYKKEKKNSKGRFMTGSRPAEIIKARAVRIEEGGGHQVICAARRMLKKRSKENHSSIDMAWQRPADSRGVWKIAESPRRRCDAAIKTIRF